MAGIPQQGQQELPVERTVIDNKDFAMAIRQKLAVGE